MQSEKLQSEACKVLEWAKLLELLASYARSTVGADQCRSMELERDVAQARIRQEETSDMRRLRAGGESLDTSAGVLRLPVGAGLLGRVVADDLVLDAGDHAAPVGSELRFGLNYSALVRAVTSPFVATTMLRTPVLT